MIQLLSKYSESMGLRAKCIRATLQVCGSQMSTHQIQENVEETLRFEMATSQAQRFAKATGDIEIPEIHKLKGTQIRKWVLVQARGKVDKAKHKAK